MNLSRQTPLNVAAIAAESPLPSGVYLCSRRVSGMAAYFYRTSHGDESDLRVVWPRQTDDEVMADLDDELRTAEMELTFRATLGPARPLQLLR